MQRRLRFSLRFLFAAILCAAIGLGSLVVSRDSVINRSNYNKIELGMMESTVDELLEVNSIELPPLSYEDVAYVEPPIEALLENPPPYTIRAWKRGGYMISVTIDNDGRVVAKHFQRAHDASIIDRIADWLRL